MTSVLASTQILMAILHAVVGYEYTTNYITMPVDHFSYTNNDVFSLRYLVSDKFWDRKKGPIFFYTGNESPIEIFAENTGFMWDTSREFHAMVVFAEHRYYGYSMPYGYNSFDSKEKLGYLTSQQAIADFVEVIHYLRTVVGSKKSNPVIAFGGSYGGILAAWLRIKYPAVVEGAIASSAPIWMFPGMTPCNGFHKVTSLVYRNESSECAKIILASWKAIDIVADSESGKTWLKDNWRLCEPLDDIQLLKKWAIQAYTILAMANYPYESDLFVPLPANPIKEVCKQITNNATEADNQELLKSVFRGLSVYFNYTGSAECLDFITGFSENMVDSWNFQSCTELVAPMCSDGDEDDIFEAISWDFESFSDHCKSQYDVRPIEDDIEKQYGGKDLKAASNIVFSNGLLDPWHIGGVLKNVSSTVRALLMPDAAHHLDLRASHSNDPQSVIQARIILRQWIRKWIQGYKNRE